MKKIIAILFISILLFNIAGYKLIFSFLETNATLKLEAKIDSRQYNEDQLIEIKIPLQLPYYTDSEYQSCYGETEFKGKHYCYVKRKVSGNMLYLLCLQHVEKNNITASQTDFEKAVNDVPRDGSQQKSHPSFIKLMLSDFLQQIKNDDVALRLTCSNQVFCYNTCLSSQAEPQTASHPPDFI